MMRVINIDSLIQDDDLVHEVLTFAEDFPLGIFQMGTDSGIKVMKQIKLRSFEDIVHLTSLNRPGPRDSGLLDIYLKRRNGEETDWQEIPGTEITYGVPIFQESIMKALSATFDISLSKADIIRRAIGKKKLELVSEFAKELDFDTPEKDKLWSDIIAWSRYGFNRAHAVAYSMITLKTAYLKYKYPALFYANLINLEAENFAIRKIMREALSIVTIRPPNGLNEFSKDCYVDENGDVILGIILIAGIGKIKAGQIMDKIKKDKTMTTYQENLLIKAGFLDGAKVHISDYKTVPSANYVSIGVSLDEITPETFRTVNIITVKHKGRWMVEDNSGAWPATFCSPSEEGFSSEVVYRSASNRLFVLPNMLKDVAKEEWFVVHASPKLTSKKGNDYYRILIVRKIGGTIIIKDAILMAKDGMSRVKGKFLNGEVVGGFFKTYGDDVR